jgi:serine protease Do
MTTLPNICLALFISLSALQPGYGSTPSPGRWPAQMPSRRPLSAGQVARKVLPSVVYIEMEGVGGKPGCYGSGFFVTSTQILTNKHVVTCSEARRGRVKLAGGQRSYPTKRIVAWPDLDVALIEAEGLTASPLQLDTVRQLSVGDDIYVAGNPEGLEGTFTRGIVSGVRSQGGVLQIDAPVSSGSSGGPVVDTYGSVVGVTVSSIREGQNLNFAIPARLLAPPLKQMQQMLARVRKGSATTDANNSARTPTPPHAAPPTNATTLSPARRTWEANHNWADFVSGVVGDSVVKDELKALLNSRVDINATDRSGHTALHLAAILGQAELARYLLSRGADINARNIPGRTPLMLAVSPGDFSLPGGGYAPLGDFWTAPPCGDAGDVKPAMYETPWPTWYSIVEARRPLILALLAAGADLTATDRQGRTAFDHSDASGLTGFEHLLHVPGKSGLPPACDLRLNNAPALRGLRLGMSVSEVSARLGGLRPTPGRCGLSTLYLSSRQLPASARGFEGVAVVRMVFLDDKVAYLNVGYGREFPFKSFDEYLSTLSSSLGLPGLWRRVAGSADFEQAQAMTCEGFVVAAGRIGSLYVELHDTEAVRTLVRRDIEAGQRQKQEAEREAERRRRSFKP